MKNLLRSSRFWLMVGNIFNAIFGFLSIGLLARSLSTDDFGSWVIFVTNMGFVEMIRSGFVYQALVKFVSGSSEEHESEKITWAAWQISLLLSVFLALLIFAAQFLFSEGIKANHFELFFKYYPIVLLLMLPVNMAVWVAHAKQRYLKMWLINFLSSFPFLVIIFVLKNPKLIEILWVFALVRGAVGVFCLFDFKFKLSNKIDWDNIKRLLGFSKFTVLTTISTNVLKSADVLLINAFLGPSMVAIYNIPLKLLEVVEIPLRSWAMSAFPRLSKLASQGNFSQFRADFINEVKYFSFLLLPFLGIAFHFSEQIVTLYAGDGFAQAGPILKVFTVYLFIMPLDRYLGIALDSVDLPHINTMKVVLMASLNIFGDWYMLTHHLDLQAVAMVTVANTMFGIFVGLFFMNKKLSGQNDKFFIPANSKL
jgi:O-antigen/teichoic acid export membrane protein